MTVAYDSAHRGWPAPTPAALCLEDRFEILKEVGDGSFGSVALARVRSAGANVARRGTLVAVKTMKKTFDSFSQCLDLREVIFLRSLPSHPHLVPALDIFLDPITRKLHIAMEYMDGNLYQLMKARDHKHLDGYSVKSILFQILAGLEHIHEHQFFHRDIKPENILVSTSAPQDTGSSFRRYSQLVTPPSTPPAYTIKIADFGLARETHSKLPYTTYVSTRWYRAPEVLLRAGEYSAPVDIWAVGAMAVEIATLKPLFPGGNEVDQVWRVCEIMGSPGNWMNKNGQKVGGGEWKDGVKLAQKLGFSFPKMAPHSLDTILRAPQWPASLAEFVTWCLMWDPKHRPTSTQALAHEYFKDAIDPLRPKSSSKLLNRKPSNLGSSSDLLRETSDSSLPTLTTKTSSWFRKSLIQREVSAPAVPQHVPTYAPTPVQVQTPSVDLQTTVYKARPNVNKRATWANGLPSNAAPMPILPTIRPISPLVSGATAAQKPARPANSQEAAKKIGRQLSVHSHGNHYADVHRQEAERALNGQQRDVTSPTNLHRESFFSHLRKRARRFSGRYQTPMSPTSDDIEANAGCGPWVGTHSNRQSMIVDATPAVRSIPSPGMNEVPQSLRGSIDAAQLMQVNRTTTNAMLKRHHSTPRPELQTAESMPIINVGRTRSVRKKPVATPLSYDTPDEEDELLDEALRSAHKAARTLEQPAHYAPTPYHMPHPLRVSPNLPTPAMSVPQFSYLTPNPSGDRNHISYGHTDFAPAAKPVNIVKPRASQNDLDFKWPTPPSDNEWSASATASIFAAGAAFR